MKLTNFVLILLVSLALSAYSAWSLAERERQAPPKQIADDRSGIPLIRLAEAEALWRQGSTVFVDVRSETDYQYGHIEGAICLPDEEFEAKFPAWKPQMERAGAIVVYCNSVDCGKSLWTAIRLRQQGLMQTKIFPEGWNAWTSKRLPTAATATR